MAREEYKITRNIKNDIVPVQVSWVDLLYVEHMSLYFIPYVIELLLSFI